jgi:hypothetical protein
MLVCRKSRAPAHAETARTASSLAHPAAWCLLQLPSSSAKAVCCTALQTLTSPRRTTQHAGNGTQVVLACGMQRLAARPPQLHSGQTERCASLRPLVRAWLVRTVFQVCMHESQACSWGRSAAALLRFPRRSAPRHRWPRSVQAFGHQLVVGEALAMRLKLVHVHGVVSLLCCSTCRSSVAPFFRSKHSHGGG